MHKSQLAHETYRNVLKIYKDSPLVHLNTDESINSLFKDRKDNDFTVMYVSPWDEWSVRALEAAAAKTDYPMENKLYVIDSQETPEAFATFSIMSAPSLLIAKEGKVSVVSDYPGIINYFTNLQDGKSNS